MYTFLLNKKLLNPNQSGFQPLMKKAGLPLMKNGLGPLPVSESLCRKLVSSLESPFDDSFRVTSVAFFGG